MTMMLANTENKGVFLMQAVIQSKWMMFEALIGAVVVINAVTIGVSLDVPWDGWIYVDTAFAALFTMGDGAEVETAKPAGFGKFLADANINIVEFGICCAFWVFMSYVSTFISLSDILGACRGVPP